MNRPRSTTFSTLALVVLGGLAAGLASGAVARALFRRPLPTVTLPQPAPSLPTFTGAISSSPALLPSATNTYSSPTTLQIAPPRHPSPTSPLDDNSSQWAHLGLTCTEVRVAQRIMQGRSFSSIAVELGASDQSVRKTASRIYRKAGVGRRQDFTAQMGGPTAVEPSVSIAV